MNPAETIALQFEEREQQAGPRLLKYKAHILDKLIAREPKTFRKAFTRHHKIYLGLAGAVQGTCRKAREAGIFLLEQKARVVKSSTTPCGFFKILGE